MICACNVLNNAESSARRACKCRVTSCSYFGGLSDSQQLSGRMLLALIHSPVNWFFIDPHMVSSWLELRVATTHLASPRQHRKPFQVQVHKIYPVLAVRLLGDTVTARKIGSMEPKATPPQSGRSAKFRQSD